MVNSVNGKEESIKSNYADKVQKYGGVLVGLCLDEEGIPPTAEQRFEIAKIRDRASEYGIKPKNLVMDALTLTISAQQKRVCRNNQSIENDKGPAWYLYNAWRI